MKSSNSWQPWALAALLGVVALAAHAPAVSNDFVPFDDPDYVRAVPEVMGGLRVQNVLWAFTTLEYSNWFPVTRLSWIVDAELFGRDPAGFHATSIGLHALNAMLFFAALFRLTRELWPSVFVAAVFAVHPLHVESVAWISTRKDVLSGLFLALSLLVYERQVRGDRPRAWSAALALVYALGLMSKSTLVTLPFLLLLLDVWPLRRWERGKLRGLVGEKGLLFGMSLGMCAVTLVAQQGSMASSEHLSFGLRLQNAALAYVEYMQRAVWPVDLMALYPMGRAAPGQVLWSVVVLLAGTGLSLVGLRTRPWYFVGWFWFLGLLVPTIGLIQVGNQATADRYTYLPLAGLSIIVAWGARDVLQRLAPSLRRKASFALGTVVVVGLVAGISATRQQALTWKDGRTLWRHAVAIAPESYGVRFRFALALHDAGDYGDAVRQYEYALRLVPENDDLRAALARARLGKRRAGR